ncbi:MAG TPA: 3-oxo-tetronate 4-phosphate decarboxylase [Opitutaceae bacterium]|jgi:ribulose-5-phosphate 4-epimerase/fuculose-1-phosphate aldolase|nr:3-oxo-tetronate 4-phosphate decarboxylase [Opitutaceae bacterium]
MKTENEARDRIVEIGRSLHNRGLSPGSSGNISCRVPGGWLLTPTNSSLGRLEASSLSKLDWDGNLVGGDKPSKESPLHLALYRNRPGAGAIIHLHSTYSAAVSCLEGLDPCSCIPPLTPYFVMRVGKVPLIPYRRPGDAALAQDIGRAAPKHAAVLLANHGPVVSGADLDGALNAIEELEETAKLLLLLSGQRSRELTRGQIDELKAHFGAQWD